MLGKTSRVMSGERGMRLVAPSRTGRRNYGLGSGTSGGKGEGVTASRTSRAKMIGGMEDKGPSCSVASFQEEVIVSRD